MPTVVARFAGFLLIPLLLASLAMATDTPPDRAEFHYLHGFEASGDFEGTCDVAGLRFTTEEPGHVELMADEISLVVYRTWRNSTLLDVDGVYHHEFFVSRERQAGPIHHSSGSLLLEWDTPSHVTLVRDYYVENPLPFGEPGTLTAPLRSESLTSTPPQRVLPAGPGVYYAEHDGTLIGFDSRITGPARWVGTDQDLLQITGDGFLLLDGATIMADNLNVQLPPYRQIEQSAETPISYLQSIEYTHALVYVKGLEVTIPSDAGHLACGSMHYEGTGSTTYRRSSGSVVHTSGTYDFQDRQFTVNGTFTGQENVQTVEAPWGEETQIGSTIQGRFVSGADYNAFVYEDQGAWDTAKKAAILVALTSLVGILWKLGPFFTAFFTRVEKGAALDHPLRSMIHGAAAQRPGTTLAELVRRSGNSYSTIQHHTRLLDRLELVKMHRFGRQVHVFPPGTSKRIAKETICLREEPVRRLVSLVNGDRRKMREVRAALQKDFQRGPSWATRVVTQAERAGLVRREKTSEGVMLCAHER